MKKYLLLLSVVLLQFGQLNAQVSLSAITTQYYSSDNTQPLIATLSVDNNNSYPVEITVVRIIDVLATGHEENFCFGEFCYLPGTDTSLFTTHIGSDSSETSFTGDIQPYGNDGYDRLHFIFYDENNHADSASVTIEYFFNATGIDTREDNIYLKFNNAVNNFAVLSYGLPSTAKTARIDIHNMLGSRLNSVGLHDKQGIKAVSTSELANGIYLVSLVVNNKVNQTYRMVVNHR